MGLLGYAFLLVYWILALGGVVLAISAVWAIWRMTWAHEKIERHVAGIEQLLARQTGTRTP